jgi:hypothetical protein
MPAVPMAHLKRMNVCSKRDPGGLARKLRYRYTPPDRRARALCRQVSWLAGRHPRRPSRYKPVAVERGLAAYNCGGSHSFAVFPVRPESGTDERVIMPAFGAHQTASAACGARPVRLSNVDESKSRIGGCHPG